MQMSRVLALVAFMNTGCVLSYNAIAAQSPGCDLKKFRDSPHHRPRLTLFDSVMCCLAAGRLAGARARRTACTALQPQRR